jgi:hypothetical protein
MITLKIDDGPFKAQMRDFAKKQEGEFKRAIIEAATQMEKLAKLKVRNFTRNSKVRRGYLHNQIQKEITNAGFTGEVISHANYSQAFEEGTRPHTIRIRQKRVLAGPKRGAPAGWAISAKSAAMGYATYGKKVQHPGTQPHPFLFPAWKFACDKLESLIKRSLT